MSEIRMTLHRVTLPLAHTFTLVRGSISQQPSLIVELEHDGVRGYGEVTENSFYGHTFDSMTASLDRVRRLLDAYLDQSPLDLWPEKYAAIGGDMFALSALDMAAHDLRGKPPRDAHLAGLGSQMAKRPCLKLHDRHRYDRQDGGQAA